MYVKIKDGEVEHFPYSIAQMRKDFKNTSFTRKPTDEQIEGFGVFPITKDDPPSFDPFTHKVREDSKPKLTNGVWNVAWKTDPLTQEEKAEYLAGEKTLQIERCKTQRDEAIYQNITIPFPVADHEIQFRNSRDRHNIGNKVTGSLVHSQRGKPDTSVRFTDAANETVFMKASEMITAGMAILTAKDTIWYAYKAVRDDMEAAINKAQLTKAIEDLKELTGET